MRYLVVEKEKGLFLGSIKNIPLFAKTNILPIVKIPSFDTESDAENFIATYLLKEDQQYGVISVESKNKYVSIVDIIKQGYSEHTHELIDFMPMISEEIH